MTENGLFQSQVFLFTLKLFMCACFVWLIVYKNKTITVFAKEIKRKQFTIPDHFI